MMISTLVFTIVRFLRLSKNEVVNNQTGQPMKNRSKIVDRNLLLITERCHFTCTSAKTIKIFVPPEVNKSLSIDIELGNIGSSVQK